MARRPRRFRRSTITALGTTEALRESVAGRRSLGISLLGAVVVDGVDGGSDSLCSFPFLAWSKDLKDSICDIGDVGSQAGLGSCGGFSRPAIVKEREEK